MFFRSREFAIFGSLETVKSRIRECAEFENLDLARRRSHEHAEARNLNCRRPELRRMTDSGICWRPCSGVRHVDMRKPAEKQGPIQESVEDLVREFLARTFTNPGEKQSQSCSPKKSGFRVWTSGRFVNMLGGKDDLVCVHTGNILWGWGCCRHVKVPSSPYKRGRKGTCKRIQTFLELVLLAEGITVSLRSYIVLERVKNSHLC
jgi:hypothetical protein